MKIAVTYENGQVFQHFGHTETFQVYTAENGEIQSKELVSSNGSGHGALAELLENHKVDVLICGGIGAGARTALAEAGIELYPGVSGDVEDCVQAFLKDELSYDPNTVCSHHHHEEGHDCGHNCGEDHHGCSGN